MSAPGSRILRWEGRGWEGIPPKEYRDRDGPFEGVARRTLLGGEGGEEALGFEMRYFEVAPGGYSSLEHHAHTHAVMIVRGRGSVRLGEEIEAIGPFDVVYVAPHELHRFQADAGEALGFVCVVDRERDRPVAVEE